MKKSILVPDIGDFKSVEIIEVLVAPGDSVNAEDALLTLESDKATMEGAVARSRRHRRRQSKSRR